VKVAVVSVFVDYHRRGRHHRGVLQPQVAPLIAALLPPDAEIDLVNDVWDDPDWSRDYDLVFISALHSDFDRARQISHYYRRRGAKTVLGGVMASLFPDLCQPWFDAVAIGDPESTVPAIVRDFSAGALRPRYRGEPYAAERVPAPRLDLVSERQILPLAHEATRGCPFTCEFCSLTAVGTRHHHRRAADVVRDLRASQAMLAGRASFWQRRLAIFYDNNIGGHRGHLRELCAALGEAGLRWGACVTFNVLRDAELLDAMAAGGCRLVYVGLESFNPQAIADMCKHQNAVAEARRAVDACRDRGILVTAGLMLSPAIDTLDYIERIPEALDVAGLHVPTYISFETPFPGTPHFERLAADPSRPILPDAPLADFNGYTLVTRPAHASPEAFVAAFLSAHERVYALPRRLRKLAADVPRFLAAGKVLPAIFDAFEMLTVERPRPPGRTYVAGRDLPFPELSAVPFAPDDFRSEAERDGVLAPWKVTDAAGAVLPHWRGARPVYLPRGRIAPPAPAAAPAAFTGRGALEMQGA
jgi:hypothetical protein